MKNNYQKYMKKCLQLAKKGEGKVSPNPLVGAIILDKNGNFAGQGWHKKYGEAHAEVNAFLDAEKRGIDVVGGTMVVSLEPCSHQGKTPPCADLIIKKKIKKVVIGSVDPNPKVLGAGIKKLEDAGVEVIKSVLEDDCQKSNEIFFKNQLQKMPFVAIKTATTLDGKIATSTGSSKWITSEKARKEVQKLRNKYDAILTGSGTVIKDNPSLTCRQKNGRNPVRVIIDSALKSDVNSKVFGDDGTRVIIATSKKQSSKKYNPNVEIIECPVIKETEKLDLKFLLDELYKMGIRSILIEAGGILNGAFLKQNLVDKIYQFVAPKILGDEYGKNFIEGYTVNDIKSSLKFSISSIKYFEPDVMIELYPILN